MDYTLEASALRVARHLDDEDGQVWKRSDLKIWIQRGYDKLVRATECLWDMIMFSSEPLSGNHTRKFEEAYMTGANFPILGLFQFTRESERDMAGAGALGPINNTRTADVNDANLTTISGGVSVPMASVPVAHPAARLLGQLPDGYVSIDRATHDWLPLHPEGARYLRDTRRIYETQQGGVFSYTIQQDGLFSLRTVGVPVPLTPAVTYSGRFGVLRQEDTTDLGTPADAIVGSWGILRSSPREFPGGGPWGAPRRLIADDKNTRIELFRLGKPLSQYPFEIPLAFIKYCEFWAMQIAFSQAGTGEDKALAAHFEARFAEGVEVIQKRVRAVMDERSVHMGVTRDGKRDSYLSLFPADFGRPRPFRR
jgi:hypothetical protein